LTTTTDAQGNTTTNVYSIQSGQLSRTTDALNHTTRFEYVQNYLTKQFDAQNNETTFGYDANGNRSSQTVKRTNAQGQLETITSTFEYDNLNRLTKAIQPDGTFTRTEYNALGQQSATIDQAGRRTEFAYDDLGRLTKTTYADGKFEESTFDAEGRRLTSRDRTGKVTSFEYDALGHLKKRTYSDGTFTRTNYDAAGQVLNSVDAKNNVTTFTYDDAGRRLTVKNALNQVSSFAYDANGNQSSMTDALNHTTSYVYDSLNRKTRTNFADGSFVETTFDVLGRRVSEKDQAGKVTSFIYDSLGRLTKVKDALNQETTYGYNELGQQISQKDALNRETKFEYDKLGRRTKRILPLGQIETYSYATDGNLQSKTDFNGKTTTFGYDNMRRLMSKTPDASLNEPTVSFTYNDAGQRATMTDASGVTNYSYDSRNRLQSKQTPEGSLSYTYDESSSIKTVRSNHTNGVSVDYAYDELNRLSSVKDNRLVGNQNTTYSYDAVGNLQSYSYPNAVTTSYAYNNLNRLTALTVSNATNGLASYAYTLGASGNRTQVVEGSGRTVNYAYDDLYRLTSETIANSANNGQISYQYDAVGNRLQRNSNVNLIANQTSSYDANDRLNSDVYDNNGSTKVSNGKSYNYDFENKLTSTSNGITIVYDGDGNRVSKTVNGVTTKYLVDTNNLTGYAQVVEELQNNQVVKAYTYGLDLISQRQSSGVSFYNYDGHGSVRGLSNASGNVTDTYDYDAFGTLINRTGVTDNNYLYAGEQFDADLGFYYNRARYLNVSTGRFISQDNYAGNTSDPRSLHKYTYVHNEPSGFGDPRGEFEISIAGVTVNISISSAINAISIGSARLGYYALTRLLSFAAATYAVLRSPVLQNLETEFEELEGTGEVGIIEVQSTFMRYEGTISEVESEVSSLSTIQNYPQFRVFLNRFFTGGNTNPSNIEWHHLVEQSVSRFSVRAINSFSNVVPTPAAVHEEISAFYSGRANWLPEGFTRVRDYIATLPWEEQWQAGLEIWQEAMEGGTAQNISWHP
jgi:RHS repeat-associated protein